ncbi:hypothetical protein BDZ97DRAFT_1629645, partial [Flammula alnicola]
PASDEHITKYSQIRLSTLFTNPEAFGSTYSNECLFTREQWHDRVNTRGRTTLFAATSSSDGTANEDWIGTLSILSPEMLDNIPPHIPYPLRIADALESGTVDVYMLVGMWVHPEHRRKGVGGMLVRRALDVVRNSSSNLVSSDAAPSSDERRTKVILLRVHDHNDTARGLYERAGF